MSREALGEEKVTTWISFRGLAPSTTRWRSFTAAAASPGHTGCSV